MKNILFIILIHSLFAGSLFIRSGVASELEVKFVKYHDADKDVDFDSGPLIISYIHPVANTQNLTYNLGFDLSIAPYVFEGYEECYSSLVAGGYWWGDEYDGGYIPPVWEEVCEKTPAEEFAVSSIYVQPTFLVNERIEAWIRVGISRVTSLNNIDEDGFELKSNRGMGIDYIFKNNMLLGLSYIKHSTQYRNRDSEKIDLVFSSINLCVGYRFN